MDPSNYKRGSRPHIEAFLDPSAILGEGSFIGWYGVVQAGARIGRNVHIWHGARVLADVQIGDDVSIGGGTEIGRGSVIGARTRIGANSFLPPNSVIGEGVFIGPNVSFADDMHPRVPAPGDRPYDARPPVVEDGASIGMGALIRPGVRIGTGARVAMGAVVVGNVAPFELVMGIPARTHAVGNDEHSWIPEEAR